VERRPEDERQFSGCFGVPAIVSVLVVLAALSVVHGPAGLIAAAIGVLILFLIIGIAMTLAKRQ
jgi:hypothetical protein